MPSFAHEHKVVKSVLETLYFASCLECGSTDINFFDYGYYQGNSCGGECKKCGRTSRVTCSYTVSKKDMVSAWNTFNEIDFLIAQQVARIDAARLEIKKLQKLNSARKKLNPKIKR